MFSPWESLEERFTAALEAMHGQFPARITDLRASSLFFFVQFLLSRGGHLVHPRERTVPPDATRAGQAPAPTGSGPILLVTETSGRAARMQQFLKAVDRLVLDREPAEDEYLVFPDFEPQNLFEYYDPPVEVIEQRNAVLEALRPGGKQPKVIVT